MRTGPAMGTASAAPDPLVSEASRTLERAISTFTPERVALVSAFGPGSIVIAHLLQRIGARLPVLFIDTLHHFPETLVLAERARDRFALDLRVFRAAPSRAAFEAIHGASLWSRDVDRYHELTKVGPYRAATREFDACITGRRRDQSDTRKTLRTWDDGPPARINPLAPWSGAQVWHWIRKHDLPYNPLHDRGYASIGDEPLTSPVRQGEPERAGRWRGLARSECGIHAPILNPFELDERRHDVPSDDGP